MSSRMASTLCQKWFTTFCLKAQNFEKSGPYDIVQISPICGPNTYQIMYGEILDFKCQLSNGNIKYPIKKNCSKFAVKTLSWYHCLCWHWKSKVSPYIPYKMFVSRASEIWTNSYCQCIVRTTRNLELFDKKTRLFKNIFDKALTPFWRRFVAKSIF